VEADAPAPCKIGKERGTLPWKVINFAEVRIKRIGDLAKRRGSLRKMEREGKALGRRLTQIHADNRSNAKGGHGFSRINTDLKNAFITLCGARGSLGGGQECPPHTGVRDDSG
jgi:hypothetical protein